MKSWENTGLKEKRPPEAVKEGQAMTVNEIDKFRERLLNTEEVDERSEYYKMQAINYLELYADAIENRGKQWIKTKKENGPQTEENQ